MARKINAFCGVCKKTHECSAVLRNETEMTKHWDVHCPNCNHKFDYTEVKKPKQPPLKRRTWKILGNL